MFISAERFKLIAGSIRSDRRSSQRDESRQMPRVGLVGRATIMLVGEPGNVKPFSVRVRDISQTSIGIIHTSAIKAGDRFVLCLPASAATESRAILCTVKRCLALTDNLYAIGATFTQELERRAAG